MLIWHKTFFFSKFEYGYQNNAEFYADFETVEKNVKNLITKKLQPKKVWKFRGSPLLLLLTCKSVWQITFYGWIFSRLFPQIWNQRKILRILNTHMPQKTIKIFGVIEYIYEYILELVECKFARNGLTNWKTFFNKHFWEYYLASFCWWISSSCENHCTLLCIQNRYSVTTGKGYK